jgi:hypothetical protein
VITIKIKIVHEEKIATTAATAHVRKYRLANHHAAG